MRGDTRLFYELWVEQGICELKRKTKFRSTSNPEAIIANDLQLGNMLRVMQQHVGVRSLQSFLKEHRSSSSVECISIDKHAGDDGDDCILLDKGVILQEGEDKESVVDRVRGEFCQGGEEVCLWAGWTPAMLDDCVVLQHGRASLGGEEVITSAAWSCAKLRDSSYVTVEYASEDGSVRHHVGQVQRYVRLEYGSDDGPGGCMPLRVALIDFFSNTQPVMNGGEVDQDWGLVHKVMFDANGHLPVRDRDASFPVKIGDIKGAVICTVDSAPSRQGRAGGRQVMYCSSPQFLSGR